MWKVSQPCVLQSLPLKLTADAGIHFVDGAAGQLLVAVSDRMKGRGRQDFRCLEKDQSMHLFSLP